MRVRIETVPRQYPFMAGYQGHTAEVVATKKTEKGITAVQVETPDGPAWFAAHNLRKIEAAA